MRETLDKCKYFIKLESPLLFNYVLLKLENSHLNCPSHIPFPL